MLEHLEIDQLALIEHAEMSLDSGFQVITGETGAGKSLLLGAIGAISGQAVTKDLIREGAETAKAEAVFTDIRHLFEGNEEVLTLFEEDEDQLILSREIRMNGRNLCRVNAHMVPLSLLRQIGESVADIHGQNDRQQIFRADKHLRILDRYGRETIEAVKTDYLRAWRAWQALLVKEKELVADPEERRMLSERLRYQIQEIKAVYPQIGELETLLARRDLLSNAEKIRSGLFQALVHLQGEDDEGAAASLGHALAELRKVSLYSELADLPEKLAQAQETVVEAVSGLHRILDHLQTYPGELEETDQRVDAITRLQRKYGGSVETSLEFLAKAEEQYQNLLEADGLAAQLRERKSQLRTVLLDRAQALHQVRELAGQALGEAISRELADLGMGGALFDVRFTEFPLERAGSNGMESVEFMLSANKGEPLKPLAQTASGGEASRIMLAIKVILAEADETPLLVFDEIDSGISGETSEVVARKLKKLALSHQILCVTHQAQIAAAADQQFRISKASDESRTRTSIEPLNETEREAEIARLLSGDKTDSRSLELARSLLARHISDEK